MSIASLSKFTVPLAGQNSQGMLMPKLQYRFRVMFQNFGTSGSTIELTKQVAKAARPNVQFAPQTIEMYNSKVSFAGKPTWQTIAVSLRDDVTNKVAKLVGEQLQKQFDFMEQASAAAASNYKFTMAIEMLDGGNGTINPVVLERWECYGCYLTQTNYQSLDYAQQGAQMIDITIQPDNCIQVTAGVADASSQRGTNATAGTSATT